MFIVEMVRNWLLGLLIVLVFSIWLGSPGPAVTYMKFMAAGVCLGLVLCLLYMTYKMIKNRHIYERNRQAQLLIRKDCRVYTEEEWSRYKAFKVAGVIAYNGKGVMRLSDHAIRELFL